MTRVAADIPRPQSRKLAAVTGIQSFFDKQVIVEMGDRAVMGEVAVFDVALSLCSEYLGMERLNFALAPLDRGRRLLQVAA
jgi:hypothetical protein